MGLTSKKNHDAGVDFFLCKLDWGSYIKTGSKKIEALFHSMKFLSPEVALYLYKSTIWPCMEYIWAGAPSCYLELLDKLQKWICNAGLLVLHVLPLLNPWFIVIM